jgi:anti-sigma regulatory factor (Ser/Thr protein kinase)
MMAGPAPLHIEHRLRNDVIVVVVTGTLDLTSYAQLRDDLIKAALEVPRAVAVDIGSLCVPTTATLSVFPTVWMRVNDWPDVPILLIEPDSVNRDRLREHGITRFVPAFPDLDHALRWLDGVRSHRRVRLELPSGDVACSTARRLVHDTCLRWECEEQLEQDATAIASSLVANAVQHGRGTCSVRLELRRDLFTIAVYDEGSPFVPRGVPVSDIPVGLGLMLVEALSATWGSAPTSTGKVVWATLRPSKVTT